MEERRMRKVNQKARNLFQPNPEYPDLYPEYPGIHVTFTLFPPTKCKNPIKSMNGMMHNA